MSFELNDNPTVEEIEAALEEKANDLVRKEANRIRAHLRDEERELELQDEERLKFFDRNGGIPVIKMYLWYNGLNKTDTKVSSNSLPSYDPFSDEYVFKAKSKKYRYRDMNPYTGYIPYSDEHLAELKNRNNPHSDSDEAPSRPTGPYPTITNGDMKAIVGIGAVVVGIFGLILGMTNR